MAGKSSADTPRVWHRAAADEYFQRLDTSSTDDHSQDWITGQAVAPDAKPLSRQPLPTAAQVLSMLGLPEHKSKEARPVVEEPKDNEDFSYEPLAANEIRILNIAPAASLDDPLFCTLVIVNLTTSPKYDALSYTWGSRSTLKSIFVDESEFTVRENAYAALQRLRSKDKQCALWIDAICINQNDPSEKTRQLPLMTQIYESAQQVRIWLGEETEGSEVAVGKLTHRSMTMKQNLRWWKNDKKHGMLQLPLTQRFRGGGGAWQDASNRALEFETGEIRELMARPWWSRVWIMQEAIVGRKAIFHCGSDTIDWDDIANWRYMSRQKSKSGTDYSDHPFGIEDTGQLDIYDDFYQTLHGFRKLWEDGKWEMSIYDLLYRFRHLGCGNPRDRLFGFLGLTTLSKRARFKGTYDRDVSTTYRDFARSLIDHTKSLDILNYAREWRGVERRSEPQCAYSMLDQAKYHDTQASVIDPDGKKPRMAWAPLPPGWQRIEKTGKVVYLNPNTNKEEGESPLKAQPPMQSIHVAEQKYLPPGWHKIWDDLGRPRVFYDPDNRDEAITSVDCSELPSWSPNWAAPTAWDATPLLSLLDEEESYAAGGTQSYELAASDDPHSLIIRGVRFDRVSRLATAWHPTSDTTPLSRKNLDHIISWEGLALQDVTSCPYGGISGRKEALWRLHLAQPSGSAEDEQMLRRLVECWYDRVGWAKDKPSLRDRAGKGIVRNATMTVNYKNDSENGMRDQYFKLLETEWSNRLEAGQLTEEELEKPYIKKYFAQGAQAIGKYGAIAKKIHRTCAHRVLYVTAKGYMGLAPWNTKVDDDLLIASGGKTPFLIRRAAANGTYSLVGETYVHGIMGGEALAGSPELEDITLV